MQITVKNIYTVFKFNTGNLYSSIYDIYKFYFFLFEVKRFPLLALTEASWVVVSIIDRNWSSTPATFATEIWTGWKWRIVYL